MDCAAWLARCLASVDYRAEYAAWRAEIDGVPKSEWVDRLWSTRTIRTMRQFCSGETDNQSLWVRVGSPVVDTVGPWSAARCSQ